MSLRVFISRTTPIRDPPQSRAISYTIDFGILSLLNQHAEDELARLIVQRTSCGSRLLLMENNPTVKFITELPIAFARHPVNSSFLMYERVLYPIFAHIALVDSSRDRRLHVGSGRGKAKRWPWLVLTTNTCLHRGPAGDVDAFLECLNCSMDVYCLGLF